MKVSDHTIFRTGGSRCVNSKGNDVVKAHSERTDKLHQLSLVTLSIAVKLSDRTKPATLLEETEERTARAIRGKMMLRVSQRMRMNVGDPNSVERPP